MSLNGVMHNTKAYPQWKADFMSPIEGLVRNALHTRKQPWTVLIAGVPCALHAPLYRVEQGSGERHVVGVKPLDSVSFYIIVHLGTERWLVELGQGLPLSLHPAMASVSDESHLPQALRHAVMELLLTPLVEAFGAFMDMQVYCEVLGAKLEGAKLEGAGSEGVGEPMNMAAIEDMKKQANCALPLILTIPETGAAKASIVPCIVHILGHASASHLYQKVSALEPAIHDIAGLAVPVSIEAGTMLLTAEELASLRTDDILLPDSYLAREGRLTLRLSQCMMPCVLNQGNATVEAIVPLHSAGLHAQGEGSMNTEQNGNSQAAQANVDSVHVAGLEVTLSFELERRTMTLAELSMISPGYTFPLGVDALAPVTLRVGDKVFGAGRLVDMAGTMGVQVTSLADSATVRKPIATTAEGVGLGGQGTGEEKRAVRGLASFKQEQANDGSLVNGPTAGDYA